LQRAIFLDRDGVINYPIVLLGKPYAPKFFNEFVLYPDAIKSLQEFRLKGYALVVVTNQPDIGHGLIDMSEIIQMHQYLERYIEIELIQICPHKQDEGCLCRKPKAGMLFDAAKRMNIDLPNSWLIGDRISDIQAGNQGGVNTIFIDRGYAETQGKIIEAHIVSSLQEACSLILATD
jgi:D-glycero-D-manno-heptose 1,7-bisphosphate phosphatase